MTLNHPSNPQESLLKEITSGKYRDYYLIYNRKSTDEPDTQKNSIKYQKLENARAAFKNHIPIANLTLEGFCKDGVINEKHSGFKEDIELQFGEGNSVTYCIERPKFYRLAEWTHKKYFRGFVSLCWDRVSRNKGDNNILDKLMQGGVDIRFTLTEYDKSSSGELHKDIDGIFAEHHSRVTQEKVSLTIRNSRERGWWTNKAGVGYQNNGSMERKPKDPVRAPLILRFAELADQGWSLADIARWAIEQGFTMPPMRRRKTKEEKLAEEEDDIIIEIEKVSRLPRAQTIHKILTNPFYTGKIRRNDGTWIPSTCHEAIIPEELFNSVQAKLRKRNKSVRYVKVLDHPCRGKFSCEICGRIYTPYPKKGILYFGTRCRTGCVNPRKNFNFDFISGRVRELIANLSFTDDEREEIDARMSTEIALLESERQKELEVGERKKRKLVEDLAYLNANRLSLLKAGAYTPEMLAQEESRLTLELTALRDAEAASDISMHTTVKDAVKISELLKNLDIYYENALPKEKDEIIGQIFSELTLNGDTLRYKCKSGFSAFESRFVPGCGR